MDMSWKQQWQPSCFSGNWKPEPEKQSSYLKCQQKHSWVSNNWQIKDTLQSSILTYKESPSMTMTVSNSSRASRHCSKGGKTLGDCGLYLLRRRRPWTSMNYLQQNKWSDFNMQHWDFPQRQHYLMPFATRTSSPSQVWHLKTLTSSSLNPRKLRQDTWNRQNNVLDQHKWLTRTQCSRQRHFQNQHQE